MVDRFSSEFLETIGRARSGAVAVRQLLAPSVTVQSRSRMNQRVRTASIFVLLLAFSSVASAGGQGAGLAAGSFSALKPSLTPGERLIVRDSSGRKTHGRFVSLSGNELEIERRRWNFRTERRTWTEGTVDRIQHEDSRWEGGAVGAAVGLAAVVFMVKSPRCDERCLPFVGTGVQLGALIGAAIDGSINLTLYASPLVSRFNIAPAAGLHRVVLFSHQLPLARVREK
jgi:hypothetical protein